MNTVLKGLKQFSDRKAIKITTRVLLISIMNSGIKVSELKPIRTSDIVYTDGGNCEYCVGDPR